MARWHSANVLSVGPDTRRLWEFDTGGFAVVREHAAAPGEKLPEEIVARDWRSLFRRKLNIAWLPTDKVYLRALQLPVADFAETLSMVEFQLEKLSPLPVAQIVWTIEVLPQKADNLQTVIVIVVPRNVVEEFLGQLETHGYLPDRLELPILEQLLATPVAGDGVWIYPAAMPGLPCAVAWWYGGVLRNVTLLPSIESNGPQFREQLAQIAWAGELEGWLTSPPRWHLVADAQTAATWKPLLDEWADQPVQVVEPLPAGQLASRAAERVVRSQSRSNLLPSEHASRYQQQFIDSLWMRGLGAVLMIYVMVVAGYFSALYVLKWQHDQVQTKVKAMSQSYANTVQMKEKISILEEQANLKYAALDCWKAASDLLPQELTLTGLTFRGGKTLTISGTVPQEHSSKVTDYNEGLRQVKINGKPLIVSPPNQQRPVNNTISWSISCEIQRGGA